MKKIVSLLGLLFMAALATQADDGKNPQNGNDKVRFVAVYAIRAEKTKEKEIHVDDAIKDLKRYLRRTGYNHFSLITKRTAKAAASEKAEVQLPDNLELQLKVEKVTKTIVRIHMRLVRITPSRDPNKKPKETVIIDTKYALKTKPLVVVGVKLTKGYLVLAFRIE